MPEYGRTETKIRTRQKFQITNKPEKKERVEEVRLQFENKEEEIAKPTAGRQLKQDSEAS